MNDSSMRGLYAVLPTFSPDFSGVCSTLFELDGTLIIHDAGGCTGTYTGYDEPRWFDHKSRVFTSNLDDAEAVFGDDDLLVSKAISADQYVDGSFFALMGSPSPAVLGTDYRALCKLIQARTGKPAMSFSTTGTRTYDKGIEEALLMLAKTFLPAARPPVLPDSVNLIGATPLDLTHQRNVDRLGSILRANGLSVGSVWAMGSCLNEIKNSLASACNIALTASALPVCRYLEQQYGMPWIAGSFAGQAATAFFLKQLKNLLADRETFAFPTPSAGQGRALVIGEQLMANGIRHALEMDFAYSQVEVMTFFSADSEFMRPGDRANMTEAFAEQRIKSGDYDLIVGDGLLRLLEAEDQAHCFVELPHVAISSRLGWGSTANPFGDEFNRLVDEAQKEGHA